jgi:hypothetical protein
VSGEQEGLLRKVMWRLQLPDKREELRAAPPTHDQVCRNGGDTVLNPAKGNCHPTDLRLLNEAVVAAQARAVFMDAADTQKATISRSQSDSAAISAGEAVPIGAG